MNAVDVAILGGGLAGLTLARQCRMVCPDLSIAVIERRRHPVPVAAFKVGESTVENGARYLSHTLGLRSYLDEHHLKKFGLRCFFGDFNDIARADEIGTSQVLPVPTYQLDRGLLENHLADSNRRSGITGIDSSIVDAVDFESDGGATVRFRREGHRQTLKSRWVVDASGRKGILRRQLNLGRDNALNGDAVWFRVDERVRIDDWSASTEWQARIAEGHRWLSTNHLMGEGFWAWLIPLSSGATSVGLVTDAARHPAQTFSKHSRAMGWFDTHLPQCAQALSSFEPMDFSGLRNYSYDCNHIFSPRIDEQRWALTGEAGVFLDPFYSPGTDFIAYGNTFIVDLIERERRGERIGARSAIYQQLFQSFYASSLSLYTDQYAGFGNYQLMALKTAWDYAYYWGVLGTVFFNDALTDIELFRPRNDRLGRIRRRHDELQARFRDYAAREPGVKPSGAFTDHRHVPVLYRLNAELVDPVSGDALGRRLDDNLALLDTIADEIAALIPTANRSASRPSSELLGTLGHHFATIGTRATAPARTTT